MESTELNLNKTKGNARGMASDALPIGRQRSSSFLPPALHLPPPRVPCDNESLLPPVASLGFAVARGGCSWGGP